MSNNLCILAFGLCLLVQVHIAKSREYGEALTKSLLFYEAQRSGKLPPDQRVQWRGDSALHDGKTGGIDLVGGYYDAGDNVKFGFPMAYTVTMLAWSVVEFGNNLKARNEYWNALKAVKWGTDYMMKAHPEPNRILEGKFSENGNLGQMKNSAEQYICNCIQKGYSNVQRTSGGLLWFLQWSNLQYVTSASFIITAYADYLSKTQKNIQCASGRVGPNDLMAFAKSQVDYMLGSNPKNMSYMVGFGSNYPKQVHHRGASIVSIKKDSRPMSCQQGFEEWFHKNQENPNVLTGAIVGGPDQSDQYTDARDNYEQAEPSTANNAPLVGVLARLAA
ncbi:hypothetical protein ACP275_06G140800 [Erythranthe tilingii]